MNDLINKDISRCNNYKCPTKAFCARFRQIQIDRESEKYPLVSVTHFDGDKKIGLCDYFINVN